MDSYVNTEYRCAVFKFSTLGNDSIFYTLDGTSPAKRGVYYATDSLQIDGTAQLRSGSEAERLL
ncbi:FN3 associated domain-containing protein [Bacteroides thetaiotaomicron]|uniref:FN3 associated domain-containing protein n=1 Tax=Bacteroides thetaiotaomicron TaxID=818 RepID=UPI002166504C|nr:FN3 associated domain-containing protein [Bacteroides thetaiotaomicron]MCS2487282.1 chitobiase/beta-hexosaminidase C-terminal domain-containing protein [Bacteroides thetaiotaomicron]